MSRSIPALLAATLLMSGCGTASSSDEPEAAAPPTPSIAADERSIEAVDEAVADLAARQDAAKKAGDTDTADRLEQEMQAIEQAQRAAFEKEFDAATPFDKAVDSLPLDEPPLYVEQFMLDDSHELVVRVRPKRFFCDNTEAQRQAAVRAYYRAALKTMKANGIDDFALIVDSLRDTGIVRALARAERNRVSLTALGRGAGPC